jgi:hypothetical protein
MHIRPGQIVASILKLLEWSPDTGPDDANVRTIFIARYAQSYFSHARTSCPSLGSLDAVTLDKIARRQAESARETLRMFTGMIAAFLILIVLSVSINPHSHYAGYVSPAIFVSLFVIGGIIMSALVRRTSEATAVYVLYNLIVRLETRPGEWAGLPFRQDACMSLSRVASCVQRIPHRLAGLAPSVRRQVITTARNKAQAIRELQIWVMQPGPFTYTDLIQRLTSDLYILADGRWYDLPEAPYVRQMSRTRTVFLVFLALALVGVTAYGVSFIPSPAGPVVSVIVAAVAVAIVNAAGLPVALTERFISAGSDLTGGRR